MADVKNLMEQFLSDRMSRESLDALRTVMGSDAHEEDLKKFIEDVLIENRYPETNMHQLSVLFKEAVQEANQRRKEPGIPAAPVHRVGFLRRWGWAAACILLLLSAGAYFWRAAQKPAPVIAQHTPATDVAPGRQGAILTLADGSKVVLDSLGNGLVAAQQGAKVMLHNGQLVYAPTGETNSAIAWNTMTTPRGRQHQLVLPDGSKVWLNAASSLTYPTVFTGSERTVSITGEAYFEVAKQASMPFVVKINDATMVRVLGTHFNINAYSDEASINTTLLEGSVKVLAHNKTQLLHPGQQAWVGPANTGISLVDNADVAQAVAWKDGLFSFTKAGLPEVMRQLARWYDVKVIYEGKVPERAFTGEIGRGLSLSQVLEGLAKNRIQYKIDNGNTVTISK